MSDRKIKYPIRSSEVTDEEGRRGDEYRGKPGTRHTQRTQNIMERQTGTNAIT